MARWLEKIAAEIGVSRVARITGLDRGGVEVACAIRPGGHVLQVSNGKGLHAADARAGAVLESAELWAAERPSPSQLIFASLEELESRGLTVWPLEEELLAPELFTPSLRIAWLIDRVWGPARLPRSMPPIPALGSAPDSALRSLVCIPAAAVFCPPSSGPWLGPAVHRWTSNGMGAHPEGELALRHALLEAAERDGLARALPGGWSERELKRRKLREDSLESAAPRTAALVRTLCERGLSAHLFDLTPATKKAPWMDLPLAGALLIDDEEGPVPLVAGYACAGDRDAALLGALLEAAQSRLTDVHGAREDIAPADRDSMRAFARAVSRTQASRRAEEMANAGALSSGQLVARFAAAGFARVAALDLSPSRAVRVVKVVAPGLKLLGALVKRLELIAFLGPSLPRSEAARALTIPEARPVAVSIEPPAQQGDLWRALSRRPRVIALIDGLFESAPSVWHHELLDALDAGVLVFGASSMGALRASELAFRGMIGVGQIFAACRDGLDDDAAVALLHGDAESGFQPLTVPLVNAEHAIEQARAAGAIPSAAAKRMLKSARAMHYQDRRWPELVAASGLSGDALAGWSAFAARGLPDLKADDARLCLREAARAAVASRTSGPQPARLRARPASAQVRGLRAAQLSAHAKAPSAGEERAMAKTLFIAGAARAAGLVPSAEELAKAEAALVSPASDREDFLLRAGIAEDELRRLVETLALEALALENAGRFLPDGPSRIEAFRAAQVARALRRR